LETPLAQRDNRATGVIRVIRLDRRGLCAGRNVEHRLNPHLVSGVDVRQKRIAVEGSPTISSFEYVLPAATAIELAQI
jgi:hypothetical protein